MSNKTSADHVKRSGFNITSATCQDCPTKATSAGTRHTKKQENPTSIRTQQTNCVYDYY